MSHIPLVAVVAAATAALVPGAKPAISVTPHTVRAGAAIVVTGNAGSCVRGDQVTLISRGFASSQQFAGVPAVFAHVGRGGGFRAGARATRRAGVYVVTGRCGGGNLGVAARFRVRS
jgi:hypothetical protein